MTNWIPTDRIRGGYEPADSLQDREYSDLSALNPSKVTPGSYANPIGAVVPSPTSIRPAPEQLDPVQLNPSAPPGFQKSGDNTFNNGVIDVSIIPYMRRLDIDFTAVGLRPNRRVYFFFDDVNVTSYISLSNTLTLKDNPPSSVSSSGPDLSDIQDDLTTVGDTIIANTSPGWSPGGGPVAGWRRRDIRGRKRMQVRRRKRDGQGPIRLEITGGIDTIPDNSLIKVPTKDKLFQIEHSEIRSGKLNPSYWFLTSSNTANAALIASTIMLDSTFQHLPNNWWGTDGSNTAFLLNHHNHPKRGRQKFRIRGWNNGNRYLTVDPVAGEDVPGFTVNPFLDNDDSKLLANDGGEDIADALITISSTDQSLGLAEYDAVPQSTVGVFKTDSEGSITGTFHMPGGTFFTGQKLFRIIDHIDNDIDDDSTTTYAEYKFVAQGLHTIVQEVNINTPGDVTIENPPGGGQPPPPKRKRKKQTVQIKWPTNNKDPLAQSFWVEKESYPQGMFLSSVDLFFANKDPSQPVSIEIRPTVNGYPHSYYVVPGSKVTVPSDEVKISDLPDFEDDSTKTKFKFSDPVYLPFGEYALVIYSPSPNYEVYLSELGEKIIGTNNIVSEQPYVGSIFKSQNATTWDASQLEDLMFVINKCVFVPEGRAVLYSSSVMQPEAPYGLYPVPVDEVMIHSEQSVLPDTDLTYELASDSTNVFSEIQASTILIPEDGRIFYPANSDDFTSQEGFFKLAVNMTTENPDISPVIWSERFGIAMFENQIDNAEPTPLDFKIISTGSGYPVNSELALAFSGSGNGDAEIYAKTNSTGHVVDLIFDNYGSGFTEDTTVSVVSGSGSGAVITLTSETDSEGGPAWCKYISRTVTLNQGFESSDIRAYVTAYKPIGTGIHVYYKVRNNNDPEPFAKKQWVKMVETQGLVQYSRNSKDFLEFEFTPFGEDGPFEPIKYTSGGATYTTFDQYAIKIVITSDDTTYFPVLKDLRAIALAAAEDL